MSRVLLKNINKVFGKGEYSNHVIKDVSIDISSGTMVAILGPSGSGKSTLLNIIGCMDSPTGGEYYLDDELIESLNKNEISKIRNIKIGFVFQTYNLIPVYRAVENVELPLFYANRYRGRKEKLSRKQIREIALEKLDMVGLGNHYKKFPTEMSGGQQQRVGIARALVNDPQIIIADEPTGALDQETGNQIMGIITEINNKGKTIIIVTHNEQVASLCKTQIRMRDGMIRGVY